MKEYSIKSVSKNRDTIYGLSMLWIALFHSVISIPGKWAYPINAVKSIGNVGVDIFLMMSGISLFFSFSADSNILRFYSKRLKRVLLPSLLVGIPYFLYTDLFSGKGAAVFLLDLTGISFFTNGTRTIWFVTAILILYLLYPAIYAFFSKKRWSVFALLGSVTVSLLVNLALKGCFPALWARSEVLFRRVPVYLLGSYLGKTVFDGSDVKASKGQVVLTAIFIFIAFAAAHVVLEDPSPAFERYAYIPLAFGAICLFSVLGDIPLVKSTIGKLAPYTLEVYLTHEKTILLCKRILEGRNTNLIYLCAFLTSLLAAVVLGRIEKLILKGIPHLRFSERSVK